LLLDVERSRMAVVVKPTTKNAHEHMMEKNKYGGRDVHNDTRLDETGF
jgi:hypothetical protein